MLSLWILFSILLLSSPESAGALSVTSAEASSVARNRLQEALRSLSGKPTLTPEIVIPEPKDPTVLLLRSSQVTTLSATMRTKAKANAACVAGSLHSLRTFCTEQETVRGNFPGPIPVIYSHLSFVGGDGMPDMKDIANAGASGVVTTLCEGRPVMSIQDIQSDTQLVASFRSAIHHGIQIIPEIVLSHDLRISNGEKLSESTLTEWVDAISSTCGSEPAAVLITIQEESSTDASKSDIQKEVLTIPKALTKRIPIVGSIRVLAGQNRMGAAVSALKAAGFTGSILRSECVPGFRMNPDLDFVSGFWTAAISDLKSTKSKSFNFRSKIVLGKREDLPLAWYNYQKSVMNDGSLGSNDAGADPVDSASGDYVGF